MEELDLEVGAGDIYAFLGLNGAGKTTTIRMLLGMIRPTSGSAFLFGGRAGRGDGDLWARVGYLVESPRPWPELTVRENLGAWRRLYRLEDPASVDRTLEEMGLAPYADVRASTLSQGNRQRLGLARALIHRPELLILDEPANGLDPAGVVEVRELLLDLATEQGTTIFLSSHILGEVARLATRVGIIHHGRLVEELDSEVLQRHQRSRLVVDARDREGAAEALAARGLEVTRTGEGLLELDGPRAVEAPEEIARLLVEAGHPPARLSVEEEGLESYFLRLVGREER
ncbi:MAG: ABC transporter ATP-binding protein [bacterium]